MDQTTEHRERRREPRWPKAFSFWIRPEGTDEKISAWMLDMSKGGAAFLVAPEQAPPVRTRLELLEMLTADPTVRADSPALPPFARVLRHDEGDGITTRVAVQFEADEASRLLELIGRRAKAFRLKAAIAPTPPPVPAQPSTERRDADDRVAV